MCVRLHAARPASVPPDGWLFDPALASSKHLARQLEPPDVQALMKRWLREYDLGDGEARELLERVVAYIAELTVKRKKIRAAVPRRACDREPCPVDFVGPKAPFLNEPSYNGSVVRGIPKAQAPAKNLAHIDGLHGVTLDQESVLRGWALLPRTSGNPFFRTPLWDALLVAYRLEELFVGIKDPLIDHFRAITYKRVHAGGVPKPVPWPRVLAQPSNQFLPGAWYYSNAELECNMLRDNYILIRVVNRERPEPASGQSGYQGNPVYKPVLTCQIVQQVRDETPPPCEEGDPVKRASMDRKGSMPLPTTSCLSAPFKRKVTPLAHAPGEPRLFETFEGRRYPLDYEGEQQCKNCASWEPHERFYTGLGVKKYICARRRVLRGGFALFNHTDEPK